MAVFCLNSLANRRGVIEILRLDDKTSLLLALLKINLIKKGGDHEPNKAI